MRRTTVALLGRENKACVALCGFQRCRAPSVGDDILPVISHDKPPLLLPLLLQRRTIAQYTTHEIVRCAGRVWHTHAWDDSGVILSAMINAAMLEVFMSQQCDVVNFCVELYANQKAWSAYSPGKTIVRFSHLALSLSLSIPPTWPRVVSMTSLHLMYTVEVRRGLQLTVDIYQKVIERKLNFCGCCTRHEQKETDKTVVFEVLEGSNKPGRPTREWLDNVKELCNMDICSTYRAAQDRDVWATICGSSSGHQQTADMYILIEERQLIILNKLLYTDKLILRTLACR